MDQVVQPTGDLHKSRVRSAQSMIVVGSTISRRPPSLTSQFRFTCFRSHLLTESPTSSLLLGQPLKLCFLLRCQPHVERVGLVRRSSHIGWAETQTPHVHTQTKRGKAAPRRPHCSCGQTVSSYRGILPCPGLSIHGI
jgi:hypothetical protein